MIPLAANKLEIKKEMLSDYQLKITEKYNIHTGNAKETSLTFLIKKSMCFIMKTYNFI